MNIDVKGPLVFALRNDVKKLLNHSKKFVKMAMKSMGMGVIINAKQSKDGHVRMNATRFVETELELEMNRVMTRTLNQMMDVIAKVWKRGSFADLEQTFHFDQNYTNFTPQTHTVRPFQNFKLTP